MHVLIHIGTRRKRMRFQDEIECIDRRRSSRIIALEEKKQQERERKLALALERKNDSFNHDIRNKGKGKATMEICHDLSDSNEDEEGPTKKGRKSKDLYQLISSIKELGRHSQNASTSGPNVSSLNGMPLKHILEIIINFLQRKDPDELFAEPVNPDKVENYYEIVKQPMDFGTMRAKLHEGMYTDLEQFKRDVSLICSNAMNAPTSKYHEVAEDIGGYAKWIFEALSSDPEHFDLEFSLNKRRPGRKPQNGEPRTSRRVSTKPAGRNNAAYFMVPETEKRDMYWPPSKPLVSEVLYAKKPNIQLNKDPIKYKESLLRFVEDLGPTAQRVAAKKLEALKVQQLCNGDTPTQNLLENVSGTQIIHQTTPQTPTQLDALNAQTLALAFPFLNRPLTIPGSAAQENINVNTTNAGSVNIRDAPYQGNKTYTNDSWNACAAALLSSFFFNNDKGGSPSGIESSNARGNMNFWGLSKDKMVSPFENGSSLLGPIQENANQLQLAVNKTSNTIPWNTSAGIPNMLGIGSSSNVFAHVYPTRIISGPQPKPLKSMLSGNRYSLSEFPLMPQPRVEDTMPSINFRQLSLVSQLRPEDSMSCMPSNNLTELSLEHQPRPEDIINLSELSVVPQPRPEDIINLSELSVVPQPRPKDLMYGVPSNNLTEPSLVHQPRPEDFINLSELSLVSQPRPKDSVYGMPSNNLTELPLVHQHQSWPADPMLRLNPLRLSPLSQPKQGESIPIKNLSGPTILPSLAANFSNESNTSLYGLGTPYQLRDFQCILDLPEFNNNTCLMRASHEQIAASYTPQATQGFPDMQMQYYSCALLRVQELSWAADHHPKEAVEEPLLAGAGL
ncbi:Bromodomain and PHD finger-containing protein 3 [Spatholobus suberectus]|nr:Bromodomain and PHD finger-containing protein 3 [Spatholobus suberectus]